MVSNLYVTLDDDDSRQLRKVADKENFLRLVGLIHHHIRPNTFSDLDQEIQIQELTFALYAQHRIVLQCWDVEVLSTYCPAPQCNRMESE